MIAPALSKIDATPAPRRQGLALVLRLWDRLTIYLPLLVTGLLALVTYWLVSSAPPAPLPVPERAAKHEVDYFMRRATVKTFDEKGRLKSEILGLKRGTTRIPKRLKLTSSQCAPSIRRVRLQRRRPRAH